MGEGKGHGQLGKIGVRLYIVFFHAHVISGGLIPYCDRVFVILQSRSIKRIQKFYVPPTNLEVETSSEARSETCCPPEQGGRHPAGIGLVAFLITNVFIYYLLN